MNKLSIFLAIVLISCVFLMPLVAAGEYAFAVFQDTNNNEVKEPVALSNWSGKGLPGGWDKQKVQITGENNNNIVLQLR